MSPYNEFSLALVLALALDLTLALILVLTYMTLNDAVVVAVLAVLAIEVVVGWKNFDDLQTVIFTSERGSRESGPRVRDKVGIRVRVRV